MKDARTYERKIKKLLSGAKKTAKAPAAPSGEELVPRLVESVLHADATDRDTEKAMAEIRKEFVDHNDLRVAPEKDVLECLGKDHPQARTKVQVLSTMLNGLFNRANRLSAEYLLDMSKRDVRRHLRELGLPAYSEALVSMTCFGVHAVPVDDSLFESLQMNGLVHESSNLEDTQAFLERVIAQKDAFAAHLFFREYIAKNAKALEQKRRADAERRAAEEEARRLAEAEVKRKAEEAAALKAQREAEKEAKAAQLEAEKRALDAQKKAARAGKKTAPSKTEKSKAAQSKTEKSKAVQSKTEKSKAEKPQTVKQNTVQRAKKPSAKPSAAKGTPAKKKTKASRKPS